MMLRKVATAVATAWAISMASVLSWTMTLIFRASTTPAAVMSPTPTPVAACAPLRRFTSGAAPPVQRFWNAAIDCPTFRCQTSCPCLSASSTTLCKVPAKSSQTWPISKSFSSSASGQLYPNMPRRETSSPGSCSPIGYPPRAWWICWSPPAMSVSVCRDRRPLRARNRRTHLELAIALETGQRHVVDQPVQLADQRTDVVATPWVAEGPQAGLELLDGFSQAVHALVDALGAAPQGVGSDLDAGHGRLPPGSEPGHDLVDRRGVSGHHPNTLILEIRQGRLERRRVDNRRCLGGRLRLQLCQGRVDRPAELLREGLRGQPHHPGIEYHIIGQPAAFSHHTDEAVAASPVPRTGSASAPSAVPARPLRWSRRICRARLNARSKSSGPGIPPRPGSACRLPSVKILPFISGNPIERRGYRQSVRSRHREARRRSRASVRRTPLVQPLCRGRQGPRRQTCAPCVLDATDGRAQGRTPFARRCREACRSGTCHAGRPARRCTSRAVPAAAARRRARRRSPGHRLRCGRSVRRSPRGGGLPPSSRRSARCGVHRGRPG